MNSQLMPRCGRLVPVVDVLTAHAARLLLAAMLVGGGAVVAVAADGAGGEAGFVVYQLPPTKSPIPAKAERDAKRADIESIFEPAKAQSAADKEALAQRLIKTAQETRDDPGSRFVMLNMAREVASDCAKVQLAFDAVDLLQLEFDFDGDAVRLATIAQAIKATVPVDAKGEVVALGGQLAQQLTERDRHADAAKLLASLLELARRARNQNAISQLVEQKRLADQLAAEFAKVQPFLEKLKTTPDDAEASTAVGKYYLLVSGKPEQGLRLLTKSDNATLAEAAKLELTGPQNPADQDKLGDLWWDLANAETSKPTKEQLQSRALAWYEKAKPSLKGLMVVKATSRIRQLASAGIKPAPLMSDLGIFSRPPRGSEMPASPIPESVPGPGDSVAPTNTQAASNLVDLVDVQRDAVRHEWTKSPAGLTCKNAVATLLEIPQVIEGDYIATMEFTRAEGNEAIGCLLPVGDNYCGVFLSTKRRSSSTANSSALGRGKGPPILKASAACPIATC